MSKFKNVVTMKMNTQLILSVTRCEHSAYAEYGFNQYHYLNGINKSAKCFLFYLDGEVAGFCAVVNQTFRGCSNGIRFHRIVVLPQFSHRGLGGMICDFIAGVFMNGGYQMYMTCQSVALGTYLEKHPNNWKATANNKRKRKNTDSEGKRYRNRIDDACFCYKYIGKNIAGYENLISSISELRENGTLYAQTAIREREIINRLQKKQPTTKHKKAKSPFVCGTRVLAIMIERMNYKRTMLFNSYIADSMNWEIPKKMPQHDSHGRGINAEYLADNSIGVLVMTLYRLFFAKYFKRNKWNNADLRRQEVAYSYGNLMALRCMSRKGISYG